MPEASIPSFDPSETSAADMATALEENGAIVILNLVDENTRGSFMSDLQVLLDKTPVAKERGKTAFYPGNSKRVGGVIAKSEASHALLTEPLKIAICDRVLKPNCKRYQLHATSALCIGPGARKQTLHREEDAFDYFPLPRPNLIVASMLALSDFTEENGGTLIVPGSHKWPKERRATPEEIVSATMPAGAALLWMGGTLHAAGENKTTDDWRHGLFASFSLGWLRQEENLFLNVPPNVVNNILSPELRKLCGFDPYAGALGAYDRHIAGHHTGGKQTNVAEKPKAKL